MRQCAFLTMEDMGDYITYDHILVEPFAQAGWQVTMVPWRQVTDWNSYEIVIIRTPWNYQDHQEEFLAVLAEIEQSNASLQNPLDIVRWNIDKLYLKEMQARGCTIVPTIFKEALTDVDIEDAFNEFGRNRLIIKPTVSASALNTFVVHKEQWQQQSAQVLPIFQTKMAMLQPFVTAVVEEGEYSMFYFGDELSHVILKTPQSGDFRVQEEYGGVLKTVQPDDALLAAGQIAIKAVGRTLLYVRIDLVRLDDGEFGLMEAELIEPSLYFNMDPQSPKRFVDKTIQWLQS